jgi:hypothetical protein
MRLCMYGCVSVCLIDVCVDGVGTPMTIIGSSDHRIIRVGAGTRWLVIGDVGDA